MKKKALISVVSKQGEKDAESIEVVTPGTFYKRNESYYAVYSETEISGMEGTTTTLKISPQKFSLIRMGSTTATMDFETKSKTVSMYNTPYGTLELNIDTKELEMNVNDNGGEIFINYKMSIAGQKPQNTSLKINIKAQDV